LIAEHPTLFAQRLSWQAPLLNLLINIDLPDLAIAIAFHTEAFGPPSRGDLAPMVQSSTDGRRACIYCKSQKGRGSGGELAAVRSLLDAGAP
jgi:hypothetical protein